jgi:hypothetical protein
MKKIWAHHAAEQWPFALVALVLWCAMLPLALTKTQTTPAATTHGEWPTQWHGQSLQPLAMSAVEHRFAAQFPGRIARFAVADGGELVLRDVNRPTRMLHPAADCWRGIGWRIDATRPSTDGSQRVRVCERIVDAKGNAFTDTSAWFWAASLNQSAGPWRAITRVESL